jgi:hypothetical protein
MMLFAGISGSLYAQQKEVRSNTDKKFEIPPDQFTRRFRIDLGKGNKLQIELKEIEDLNRLKNLDSLLREFLQDIDPLRDSLSDELSSKRIDYVMDSSGRKEIRFQQFKPEGSSFLLKKGDLSTLKLEQDTVHLIGMVSFRDQYSRDKSVPDTRYYQVSFFVNQLGELAALLAAGLNDRIASLQKNVNTGWQWDERGQLHLVKDPRITAKLPKGYFTGHGDYLSPEISVNLQNYKSYFVPSFSLGARVVINQPEFKHDIGFFWEPQFLFQSADGKRKTYRNDFLSLTYSKSFKRDDDPRKESRLMPVFSIAYLIRRDGEYYDPHTIRLGVGSLSLFKDKTRIEPLLYFHDFFRGVTPGIRWIQTF